jgi:tetratricopeptide (TPR) repeat protein
MNEERIKTLLQRADDLAGSPIFSTVPAAQIRRQIYRRRVIRTAAPLTAAAVATFAFALLAVNMRGKPPLPQPQPVQIASLEEQVKQLKAQTDATLKLVREVLEKDRQQRRLAALEAELASIPDPVRQMEQQVDRSAFLLVYQADRLYKELNQTESAVAAYKEVIQLFPTNQWADVARERLNQIEQRRINKSEDKGEAKCEQRNV